MAKLTPYDTGKRSKPISWVTHRTKNVAPDKNFGKVDFDNDTGETDCTIYVEREEDGTKTVHVFSRIEDEKIRVHLHGENDSIVTQLQPTLF